MLGIPVSKLYRICDFFDSDSEDAWDLIEGEFFEYEPGQARKRRFYEEGVMAIAKYLEETEGGSFLARLKEFFTHHRARVTRALVQRRIIQVTQDRSTLVIRGDLLFLQQRSVVRVLGTNGKGMAGTLRRIEEESAGLDGAEGLEIDVHFADFDDAEGRHWSQRGIARLARTMHERGRITKARKAWVKAVADVAEDCFEVQRKVLESHEARVKGAMERARTKAKACVVTQQKPNAADRNPIWQRWTTTCWSSARPCIATSTNGWGIAPANRRTSWITCCAMSSPTSKGVRALAPGRKPASRS